MVGEVGFTRDNHIFFKMGDFYIEIFRMPPLKEILGVEEWYEDTVVLDTNYGSEVNWLEVCVRGLSLDVDIEKIVESVTEFKIISGELYEKDEIPVAECTEDDQRFSITKEVVQLNSCDKDTTGMEEVVFAVDKERGYKARFTMRAGELVLWQSTFPDEERKYQMLALVERQKKIWFG